MLINKKKTEKIKEEERRRHTYAWREGAGDRREGGREGEGHWCFYRKKKKKKKKMCVCYETSNSSLLIEFFFIIDN